MAKRRAEVLVLPLRDLRVVGVMKTGGDRNWTAQIVLSSEHAGLRPYFKQLEAELMHVLARLDDPKDVRNYLRDMRNESRVWAEYFTSPASKK